MYVLMDAYTLVLCNSIELQNATQTWSRGAAVLQVTSNKTWDFYDGSICVSLSGNSVRADTRLT